MKQVAILSARRLSPAGRMVIAGGNGDIFCFGTPAQRKADCEMMNENEIQANAPCAFVLLIQSSAFLIR